MTHTSIRVSWRMDRTYCHELHDMPYVSIGSSRHININILSRTMWHVGSSRHMDINILHKRFDMTHESIRASWHMRIIILPRTMWHTVTNYATFCHELCDMPYVSVGSSRHIDINILSRTIRHASCICRILSTYRYEHTVTNYVMWLVYLSEPLDICI